jgi:hypothetical protein
MNCYGLLTQTKIQKSGASVAHAAKRQSPWDLGGDYKEYQRRGRRWEHSLKLKEKHTTLQ